jgi:hypothetical protein
MRISWILIFLCLVGRLAHAEMAKANGVELWYETFGQKAIPLCCW